MSDSTTSTLTGSMSLFAPELVVHLDPQMKKEEVLRVLVERLAGASQISHDRVEAIVEALTNRERAATTGFGNGLAYPHLRSPLVERFCGAIGAAPEGLDFNSLDSLPTRLVVLTLSPFEARSEHYEVLGKLCSLINDHTLQYLLQTGRSPQELLALLGEL